MSKSVSENVKLSWLVHKKILQYYLLLQSGCYILKALRAGVVFIPDYSPVQKQNKNKNRQLYYHKK